MKKIFAIILTLACLFSLTGCNGAYPEESVDGTPWDKNWTILGSTLGVEEPGHGLTLLENPVVLTGNDTHYATWIVGEPTSYVNEEGQDTDLYEAELYLLLYGCADEDSAEQAVADWVKRETDTYNVSETEVISCNGQEYSILVYTTRSEINPYSRGVCAFAVYDNYAVSAEMACTEGFDGNELEILTDFLNGCHYSAE